MSTLPVSPTPPPLAAAAPAVVPAAPPAPDHRWEVDSLLIPGQNRVTVTAFAARLLLVLAVVFTAGVTLALFTA